MCLCTHIYIFIFIDICWNICNVYVIIHYARVCFPPYLVSLRCRQLERRQSLSDRGGGGGMDPPLVSSLAVDNVHVERLYASRLSGAAAGRVDACDTARGGTRMHYSMYNVSILIYAYGILCMFLYHI